MNTELEISYIHNPATVIDTLEGLFSFTIYTKDTYNSFKYKDYYYGIYTYLKFTHTNEYFSNFGVVLYTDNKSSEVIKKAFSIEEFPKLIIAVCKWPYFQIDSNTIEPTIQRCLRFEATKRFSNAIIAVRDADTIFKNYMDIYQNDFNSPTEFIEYLNNISNHIGLWEQNFLKKMIEINKPLIMGVNPTYVASWHRNFPKMKTFSPNILQMNEKYITQLETGLIDFYSNYGVYAGFVTFLKNRPTDLWDNCVNYLTSRYKIITDKDKKVISNIYYYHDLETILNIARSRRTTGKIEPRTLKIGKDERIIIFTMLPYHLDLCYFFYVPYDSQSYTNIDDFTSDMLKSLKVHEVPLIGTKYTNEVIDVALSYKNKETGKSFNETYHDYFKEMTTKYLEWIQTYNNMYNGYLNNFVKTIRYNKNIFINNNAITNRPTKNNIFINQNGGRRTKKGKRLSKLNRLNKTRKVMKYSN
jgi:hypothetical protein